MFGRSSIELEWGPGFDDPKATAARASVYDSLEIATDTLNKLGIVLNGRKHIMVEKQQKRNLDGTTSSPRDMKLFSKASTQAARRQNYAKYYDALTLGHELFHSERMRLYVLDNRTERVVAEGLAYNCEHGMAKIESALYGIDDRVAAIQSLKPAEIEHIGSRFVELIQVGAEQVPESPAWLDSTRVTGLTRAEVLGVSIVHSMLSSGAEMYDLLHLPAEEFIDLT